ncbi:MAG: DNA repair protein RecN [Armatimonadetes bacterium]|nr:DNA repair protein RecN [Armatimonadota bacterium]
MLSELEIRDFAIVESARVQLGPGLCVLTGETGAGKSIVIDAIGALVGGRAGADFVRAGCEVARLRAVFELGDTPGLAALLDELGFEPDPDDLLVVTREIRRDGRSRCTVNGSTANVGALRQLGEQLIDIHGQHEHQSLMRPGEHLRLLDTIAGSNVAEARATYQQLHGAWREAIETAQRLRLDEDAKARRADLLRYQVDEIGNAALTAGEDEELRAERNMLAHTEQLLEWATRATSALADAEEGLSAVDRVDASAELVASMAEVDADLAPLAEELAGAQAVLAEAARTLGRYAAHIEADPQRLATVEDRLELIGRLKRKYGDSIEAVLAVETAAARELAELEHSEERLGELEARRADLEPRLLEAGRQLSLARRAAGDALTHAVEGHLHDLNLDGVRFVIELADRQAPGPDGLDEAAFLFSANPGEPPRPLARIASGGEISRVMLALKSELAARDAIPTMIFDEIDVGIGGVTIRAVASKMAAIARRRQVLVVTHHAPIAASADSHIALDKAAVDGTTRLSVAPVQAEQRVFELARMLGRKPPTEATLNMARELLAEVAPDSAATRKAKR